MIEPVGDLTDAVLQMRRELSGLPGNRGPDEPKQTDDHQQGEQQAHRCRKPARHGARESVGQRELDRGEHEGGEDRDGDGREFGEFSEGNVDRCGENGQPPHVPSDRPQGWGDSFVPYRASGARGRRPGHLSTGWFGIGASAERNRRV